MAAGNSSLGVYAPWAWQVEPVHGCNLRCGHCAARLLSTAPKMMAEETWLSLMQVVQGVKPKVRVELAMCGEPTLHPNLLALLKAGRKVCPQAQFQITTNGTIISSGKQTYRELFTAGANILYVDMYAPREKHIELAKKSGYPWYEYLSAPSNAPSAWSYHGPDFKLIVLMEHPGNWPESRKQKNRLGTWLNNLDWEAAREFGLTPVVEPVNKMCLQPMRHVAVNFEGNYLLCCQDFMGETAGVLGSVSSGLSGFLSFWFGRQMQETRIALLDKDRGRVAECSRCSVTFSTRISRLWPRSMLSQYWNGTGWVAL